MNSDIFEKVVEVIKETLENKKLDIKPETSAEEIDEWDSLTHLQLISALEAQFKISFALGELQELQNVGDMVKLIEVKVNR